MLENDDDRRSIVLELSEFINRICADSATVHFHQLPGYLVWFVEVEPARLGALPVSLTGEQFLHLNIGRDAHWELDYTEDHLAFVRTAIESVVFGRGTISFSNHLTLDDVRVRGRRVNRPAGLPRLGQGLSWFVPRRIQPYRR